MQENSQDYDDSSDYEEPQDSGDTEDYGEDYVDEDANSEADYQETEVKEKRELYYTCLLYTSRCV